MVNKIASIIRFIIIELLIVWVLVLSVNNYFGNKPITISADGVGYYEYLPSLFIYKDFVRKDVDRNKNPAFFNRIDNTPQNFFADYKGYKVNKGSCGTALLISPFFFGAYLLSPHNDVLNDGFTHPYQKAVFCAALFYLFLGLLFFKKLLQLYNISKVHIVICQLLMVFSTSVIHYTYNEAAYSHVYSLFAITAFMYCAKFYFDKKNVTYFIWACALLGLIIVIRNVNVLIILLLPFLAGNFARFKEGVVSLLKQPLVLVKGLAVLLAIIFIQCLLWYLQTNTFVLYSYQGEGFNFLHPAFIDILFSYKKGLFVYAPVLFLCMFGFVKLGYQRKYYLLFTSLGFFVALTYILSSWWSWFYGCSYGLRAYIEFYPFLFIVFALLLEGLHVWVKIPLLLISAVTIPLNFIQTHQYKEGVIDWMEMDKKKYWHIFLKDGERFNWAVSKKTYDFNLYKLIDEKHVGNFTVVKNLKNKLLYEISGNNINKLEDVNLIRLTFDNEFWEDEDGRLFFTIIDTSTHKPVFARDMPLVHFAETDFNLPQTGQYSYEISPLKDVGKLKIVIKLETKYRDVFLRNLKLSFFKKK